MAASLSGSVKQLIESAGLGLAVYRDDAGASVTATTWATVSEAVSITTASLGDNGAADAVIELLQVDLYQPWRAENPGDPAEDYTLADLLYRVLHGALLPDPPMLVRSCKVDTYPRFTERDSNLVHHAFTLRIAREAASA